MRLSNFSLSSFGYKKAAAPNAAAFYFVLHQRQHLCVHPVSGGDDLVHQRLTLGTVIFCQFFVLKRANVDEHIQPCTLHSSPQCQSAHAQIGGSGGVEPAQQALGQSDGFSFGRNNALFSAVTPSLTPPLHKIPPAEILCRGSKIISSFLLQLPQYAGS